jgi:hypothetical protein
MRRGAFLQRVLHIKWIPYRPNGWSLVAAISGNLVYKPMDVKYVENKEGCKQYFEAGTALRILIQQNGKKKVPLVEN